ncbi:hypothetical protein [Mycobacterium sp.]|uniref:hypothetical protein n=1 Tax=Mycobacterium sp. TaxID=1785 RepID=UPI003A83AF13
MAIHSLGPGPNPPTWNSTSPTWGHTYVVAALRAGFIALALLAVLVLIVLT